MRLYVYYHCRSIHPGNSICPVRLSPLDQSNRLSDSPWAMGPIPFVKGETCKPVNSLNAYKYVYIYINATTNDQHLIILALFFCIPQRSLLGLVFQPSHSRFDLGYCSPVSSTSIPPWALPKGVFLNCAGWPDLKLKRISRSSWDPPNHEDWRWRLELLPRFLKKSSLQSGTSRSSVCWLLSISLNCYSYMYLICIWYVYIYTYIP